MSKMRSFEEIGLIPKNLSDVKSRKDVDPYVNGKLPIFVSPMTCILNESNFDTFKNSKVTPILPVRDGEDRESIIKNTEGWVAVTLTEFKHMFNEFLAPIKDYKILIDVADGHMEDLYNCVWIAKQGYGDRLQVMIGNIANPETYIECCKAGIDYVRVGIGGGSGCTTSVQTGFHASLPWLLNGIQELKSEMFYDKAYGEDKERLFFRDFRTELKCKTKVVADGGVNSISKAIKALALGADYVMMGRCFAQTEEACGEIKNMPIPKRHYYGQSSELGQVDRFGKVKSNPEGCDLWIPIEYTLEQFTNKFEACLRSAMSYAGAHTLKEFIGKVEYRVMSKAEYESYNK